MATITKTEREKTPEIDVRKAAVAATNYFQALFPGVSNFSLEEVELSEDEKYWLITLGVEVRKSTVKYSPDYEDILNPPSTKFKVFKVDRKTGQVLAMKNRSLG